MEVLLLLLLLLMLLLLLLLPLLLLLLVLVQRDCPEPEVFSVGASPVNALAIYSVHKAFIN